MATKNKKQKTKTRYLDINVNKNKFVSKLTGTKKPHNFSDIKFLRSLLSNEKARILYILKTKNPKSIYALAKLLGRDFKSVRDDIKILEKFDFIKFHTEKTEFHDFDISLPLKPAVFVVCGGAD